MRIIKQGDKFNDWKIINEVSSKNGNRRFLCVNSKGRQRKVMLKHLISGASKGYFLQKKKHGMSKTRIWNIWMGMKARCKIKTIIAYKSYGGRGIKIKKDWFEFEKFYSDMKEGYTDEMTLERIDVNGDYCKENCKWITKGEQTRNTRKTVYINFQGERKKLLDLVDEKKINYNTLYNRIFTYKMPLEKAILTKVRTKKLTH